MATLKQRIDDEAKTALLGGDRFRGDTLRNLKAAILNEEVALMKREEGLSDAEVENLIAGEVKKRQESATIYRQNERNDLAETEEQELAILQEFLPEQLDEAEVSQLIDEVISEIGATSAKQMGQVIGAVKAKVGNSAEGAVIARLVKEKLQD